jgi:hypothetical protein
MKALLLLWTLSTVCAAPAQESSTRAFLIGKWRVDMLDSELPLTVNPERIEMTQDAMKKMWFEFRKDGSLVVFMDQKHPARWQLVGSRVRVMFKGAPDSFMEVQKEKKRLRYNFMVDAGEIRLVLRKA